MDLTKTKSGAMIIKTVSKQFEGYTKKYAKNSKLARELHGMVGHPSEHD